MGTQGSNKTIAKNTIFLYFRMMVTMIISLYTSRVILKVLGVDDFGIYQAVGGIVGFMSFINNALSTGSSRFITFGLGENNSEKLKKIFATTFTCHVVLAVLIILVAETVGLWFLHHKMVISPDRMLAAEWVYQLSILTSFFTLTQVPFNACIIAHERMTVFAYISIVEAILKLVVVYVLTIGDIDKLVLYASLLCLLQVGIIIFYIYYCVRNFSEARMRLQIEKGVFSEILGFSGWSLFANGSIALNSQGILILLNMFFPPAVVAARAISLQVSMAANQFVNNFQTAATPQIVKLYAAKDYEGSKQLLLQTTKFSYYLMLLLSLPICMTAGHLLQLWLGVVPDYAVIFLQLIIIQSLFHVFDISFYRALYAKGQIKENALISPTIGFIQFPVVYILFKAGFSPVALSLAALISNMLLGLIIKPILIIRIVNYTWHDIASVFIPCAKVSIASLPIPIIVNYFVLKQNLPMLAEFGLMVTICLGTVCVSAWYLGLNAELRARLLKTIMLKLKGNV